MRRYDVEHIRNYALLGHAGCGKTAIGEAMAFLGGHVEKPGTAGTATSFLDTDAESIKRGGSISASFLTLEYENTKHHVVDTPGDVDFLHEARAAAQGVNTAVIVISATDGVQVTTDQVNSTAKSLGIPRIVFVNKIDRLQTELSSILEELAALELKPVLLQLPIGTGEGFHGLVDLVSKRALLYKDGKGVPVEADIPADKETAVTRAVDVLMDAVASTDDALVEKYLEEGSLSTEEMQVGLARGIACGALCPVLLGCATANIGVDRLLKLAQAFPFKIASSRGPEAPFGALCMKTMIDPYAGQVSVFRCVSGTAREDMVVRNVRSGGDERLHGLFHLAGRQHVTVEEIVPGDIFAVAKLKDTATGDTLADPKDAKALPWVPPPPPMVSYTLVPRGQRDVDRLRSALSRLLAEDIGLRQTHDEVTKELVLSGMGVAHIQVSVERLARKYGVEVELGTPSIPYRETIAGKSDVRYRHKKQTGGAGQFGEVAIRVSPNGRGEGNTFVNEIKGGAIPTALIPAVEKGVTDRLTMGVLVGFPVVDVKVALYDGKYHPVDSKDIAFQLAGRHAVLQAVRDAKPVLLEPIQNVEIVVPEDQVGDVMGNLNSRRGRILTMDNRGKNAVVKALVPLAELLHYGPELRAMTGGKGTFTMELHGFEPVPSMVQEKLVKEIKRVQEEED